MLFFGRSLIGFTVKESLPPLCSALAVTVTDRSLLMSKSIVGKVLYTCNKRIDQIKQKGIGLERGRMT